MTKSQSAAALTEKFIYQDPDYIRGQIAALQALILGLATIRKLSWNDSENAERIYLYNDGCVPTASAAHMRIYLERLAILAKLKVSP